jgi:hypothetical protein
MILNDSKIIEVLLTGFTHVLPMAGGEASVYYGVEGLARMSLPDGTRRNGKWQVTPTGYHVDW